MIQLSPPACPGPDPLQLPHTIMRPLPRLLALAVLAAAATSCADQSAPTAVAGVAPDAASPANADSYVDLKVYLRDFHAYDAANPATLPDFEGPIGAELGIVADTLGSDWLPVYASATTTATTSGKANFDRWWNRDVRAVVNRFEPTWLRFTYDPTSGAYSYSNSSFFPLDNRLFGNEGRAHNYHFTMHAYAQFVARGAEWITVTATDDAWIYVNGKLVIDLGGVHAPVTKTVWLNDIVPVGRAASIAIFKAQRHTTESTFRFSTNVALFEMPDPSPPVVKPVVDGTLGNEGWYVGPVMLDWDVWDNEGGAPGCSSEVIPETHMATPFGCESTNEVGRSTYKQVLLKRDATPPEITFQGARTRFSTLDFINITCTIVDGFSGPVSSDCAPIAFAPRTLTPGRYSYTRTAEDHAGNTSSKTVSFDVYEGDLTPPFIYPQVSGPTTGNGWYTGDVSIRWTVADPESDVMSREGCEDQVVKVDVPRLRLACAAYSAGGGNFNEVVIKRDATKPVITFTGAKATYTTREAIQVACTPSDATSGVASADCGAITFAAGALPPGPHSETRTVTDVAGNRATATLSFTVEAVDDTPPAITQQVTGPLGNGGWYVGTAHVSWSVSDAESAVSAQTGCGPVDVSADTPGQSLTCTATSLGGTASRTVSVKRDATAPTIAFAGNAGSYTVDQQVRITCSATDATSGIATATCPTVDAAAWSLGAGTRTLNATATDRAGNDATASATFSVQVTTQGIANLVERWVSNAGVANSLVTKAQKGNWDAFRNELRAQGGKKISADQAATLLRLVEGL